MAWNSCTGNSVKSSSKKLMICQAQNSNIHIYMHIYTTASRRLWKEAECFSNSLLLIAEVCSEICLSLFHWDINEHKDEAKTDKTRKGDVCCACEKLRENGRIPCSLFKGTQAFTSGDRDACRYLDTSYMQSCLTRIWVQLFTPLRLLFSLMSEEWVMTTKWGGILEESCDKAGMSSVWSYCMEI